jgi:hypothetical protein
MASKEGFLPSPESEEVGDSWEDRPKAPGNSQQDRRPISSPQPLPDAERGYAEGWIEDNPDELPSDPEVRLWVMTVLAEQEAHRAEPKGRRNQNDAQHGRRHPPVDNDYLRASRGG